MELDKVMLVDLLLGHPMLLDKQVDRPLERALPLSPSLPSPSLLLSPLPMSSPLLPLLLVMVRPGKQAWDQDMKLLGLDQDQLLRSELALVKAYSH